MNDTWYPLFRNLPESLSSTERQRLRECEAVIARHLRDAAVGEAAELLEQLTPAEQSRLLAEFGGAR